jgi:hypothetical protein
MNGDTDRNDLINIRDIRATLSDAVLLLSHLPYAFFRRRIFFFSYL